MIHGLGTLNACTALRSVDHGGVGWLSSPGWIISWDGELVKPGQSANLASAPAPPA